MKIPNLTIQQLLEAGVHLGHKTLRWNPKMKRYIFGKRDSIHIIDLTQTLELTNVALEKVYNTIINNGKILFEFNKLSFLPTFIFIVINSVDPKSVSTHVMKALKDRKKEFQDEKEEDIYKFHWIQ